MKSAALLLCALGMLFARQDPSAPGTPGLGPGNRDGDYYIRFEPSAKLQTGVEVPFNITVHDARQKPLPDAKVTLQIETTDHTRVKVFRASAISTGIYIAKPVFPAPGQWNVHVEARRDNQVSARTLEFSVSQ